MQIRLAFLRGEDYAFNRPHIQHSAWYTRAAAALPTSVRRRGSRSSPETHSQGKDGHGGLGQGANEGPSVNLVGGGTPFSVVLCLGEAGSETEEGCV